MDPLLKRRNFYKGRVAKIQTTVNKHDVNPLTPNEITELQVELQEVNVKHKAIQEEIVVLCATDADVEDQVEVSDKFHSKLLEVRMKLLQIQDSIPVTSSTEKAAVKLPRIELPTFNGQHENWQSFQDLFIATVDNNKSLSNAQKLQYLKACVKGDATNLIKSFAVTDQNYREAWGLLTDRSLKVLGRPVEDCDDFLVYLVTERMDSSSRREWAMTLKGTDPSTFKELSEFIEQHIRGLHAGGQSKPSASTREAQASSSASRRQTSSHHVTSHEACPWCNQDHPIYHCNQFKAMSPADKANTVRKLFLCFNCLKPDHGAKDCKSKSTCRKCNKKHHTLLHIEKKAPTQGNDGASPVNVQALFTNYQSRVVLLKTALVKVTDQYGLVKNLRAVLDDGSEASFITEACAKSLGLKRQKVHVDIMGISASAAGRAKALVSVQLMSLHGDSDVEIEALVLPQVTGSLPKQYCDASQWHHLSDLTLADPKFKVPSCIDLLLGADVTASLKLDGIRTGPANSPIAENTIFGWVLSGKVKSSIRTVISVNHANCQVEAILHKFWELEELPKVKHFTAEEKACETHFTNNYSRDSNGQFTVKLPFKSDPTNIGDSKSQAISRFKQIERRIHKNPDHLHQYTEFMREYQALHHMEPVPDKDRDKSNAYYLPHHFVLKEDSSTTKFRVVFDGSAKTDKGISLNKTLMVGGTIQDDLFTLLLRFSCHLIALKADITKMYRQFRVHDDDADYQRIIWREHPTHKLQEHRLVTVTYGTASAPFLATRCLQQLAKDEQKDLPMASKAILNDMYVDDLMSGESTVQGAIQLYKQILQLIQRGSMEVRKWSTNDPEVLRAIPPELRESKSTLDFDPSGTIKALGIIWNPSVDKFSFTVRPSQHQYQITKRKLLSELAKVFDPLGWLSPCTIRAKIIFQDLWRQDYGWDDQIDSTMQQRWISYQSQMPIIGTIQIPRCIIIPNIVKQEVHGFSDASQKAYAAAVYLRCKRDDGSIFINLMAAKTKVAPIKQQSIPRLELCGALLPQSLEDGSPLLPTECPRSKTLSPQALGITSVVKRTLQTVRLVESLLKNYKIRLWWNGPSWLRKPTVPIQEVNPTSAEEIAIKSEEKKAKVLVGHILTASSLVYKYSSLQKLKRITAIMLRFINNARFPKAKMSGPITSGELQNALHHWVKLVQANAFSSEMKCLVNSSKNSSKSTKERSKSNQTKFHALSKLQQLNPFIDKDGILRVDGRLHHSNIPEEKKHQIILPHDHHLTWLIVHSCHLSTLHGGFQLVLSSIQREFWILRGRNTVRGIIRKCIPCRKQRAVLTQQLMGSLPSPRVTPSRTFQHCGVDYAGPYQLRVMKGRGNKTLKCYFAIFICFSTKAVHLEAVTDLSTEAFIASFKRFAARRGVSSDLYSDCGTNFVGADKELKAMLISAIHNSKVANYLADKGTNWHFNPPSAPHHGGLWEAGVKSAKAHLKGVVGTTILTLEEFQTILCLVEACLNSRPLCALSTDPNDLNVLTPSHFLIGSSLTAVPEPDLTHIKCNRLSRWQQSQQLFQHFWNRWSNEYLNTLQQRFKWVTKRSNLQVGDLVTIKDDQLPPMKWRLGRICQVHPGSGSCVRAVTIKTSSGELKRPVVKVCPILCNDEQ